MRFYLNLNLLLIILMLINLNLCRCSPFFPKVVEAETAYSTVDTDSEDAEYVAMEMETDGGFSSLDAEEAAYETNDEIGSLISRLTHYEPTSAAEERLVKRDEDDSFEGHVIDTRLVPQAFDVWKMTDDVCMAALEKAGVKTSKPTIETLFVKKPLFLEGPIGGVSIEPRWPRNDKVNGVMDCRLALALVQVAAVAREMGVKEILYYSTYRPITKPPQKCPSGKKGKKCHARQKAFARAKAGKLSQHKRAFAIDIRWFVMEDGQTIDVLNDYERHAKKPPCGVVTQTSKGKFLRDFACRLYHLKIFNVILTPNANKAHHNHFHMDITPNAKWHIIR